MELSDFEIGQKVQIFKVDEEFYVGLDVDDVREIRGLLEEIWTVEEVNTEANVVEIRYDYSTEGNSSSPCRWIAIPPEWIKRV